MIDFDLIKLICVVAVGASIISTATIQKIKEAVKTKKYLHLISFAVSFAIGFLFAICFSDLKTVNALWVGLITFVGADAIYKAFEEKLFKPFSDMKKTTEIVGEIPNDVQ